MEPAVELYLNAAEEARNQHTAQTKELHAALVGNKRGANRTAGEAEYYKKANALARLRDARIAMARAELGVNGDPLALWMLDNCAGYPEHVDAVLKALPLDIKGLRALSRKEHWCSEFDRLLNAAVAAGVVDDGRLPERREFDQWVRANFSIRDSYITQMNDWVDKIVKAEAAAAAKKPRKKPQDTPAAAPQAESVAVETAQDPILVGAFA